LEEEIVVEFTESETQALCLWAAVGFGTALYGFACLVGKADKASSKIADSLSDKIVERIKLKRLEKSLEENSKKGDN
jgi:hypothetical protein